LYDWVKNVRFVPLTHGDVMAPLEVPQRLFGHGAAVGYDPDEGLVTEGYTSYARKGKSRPISKAASPMPPAYSPLTPLTSGPSTPGLIRHEPTPGPSTPARRPSTLYELDSPEQTIHSCQTTPMGTYPQLNAAASPASTGSTLSKAEKQRLQGEEMVAGFLRRRSASAASTPRESRRGSVVTIDLQMIE
jgi:hypothetical protein